MSDRDRSAVRAVIFGNAGPELTDEERGFFADVRPLGLILFARNCETPDQLARLVADFRAVVGGADAPVLIDQEGGRVARLGAPRWRHPPAASVFAEAARRDEGAACHAARLNYRMIAQELRAAGITVDCAPVLDLPVAGADEIIGDRALGSDPRTIAVLGRAVCDGLLDEGVLPVIKHMPGHGRALADSHKALPTVETSLDELRRTDFEPFRRLADMPWAMTAHIVFAAIDPDRPATVSRRVITDILRGEIGFDGVLLSDDIGMEALAGTPAERARAAIEAGCDAVLHCSGDFAEMQAVAAAVPPMSDATAERLARGEALRRARQAEAAPAPTDMTGELERLLAPAGMAG